jgi:hypothetical protein
MYQNLMRLNHTSKLELIYLYVEAMTYSTDPFLYSSHFETYLQINLNGFASTDLLINQKKYFTEPRHFHIDIIISILKMYRCSLVHLSFI